MLLTIETWLYETLLADTALADRFTTDFQADAAEAIRSGEGDNRDDPPAVQFTFLPPSQDDSDRCGEVYRSRRVYEVKAIIAAHSFADSQPYADRIAAALAGASGSGDGWLWTVTQLGEITNRVRGSGPEVPWHIHHGYQFEIECLRQ